MYKVVRTISPPLGFGKNCPHRVACKVWFPPLTTHFAALSCGIFPSFLLPTPHPPPSSAPSTGCHHPSWPSGVCWTGQRMTTVKSPGTKTQVTHWSGLWVNTTAHLTFLRNIRYTLILNLVLQSNLANACLFLPVGSGSFLNSHAHNHTHTEPLHVSMMFSTRSSQVVIPLLPPSEDVLLFNHFYALMAA